MKSIFQCKIHVHFLELLLLKCNENAALYFEIIQKKVKGYFYIERGPFRYVMLGGCPYFLNETLDKKYSNQLRSCYPTNRKTYITLISTP